MNTTEILHLIANLGSTHEELIAKKVLMEDELIELFPGIDELYFEPAPGLEMNFDSETEVFQTLNITLRKTTPSTIEYKGALPQPFQVSMSQNDIRRLLGEPRHYSGPKKLPEPIGQTGGWESYHLTAPNLEGLELIVGYTASMDVEGLAFSNFRREDMYKSDLQDAEQNGEPSMD